MGIDEDVQVIKRVLEGDVDSFRVLVERYEGVLFGLLRNLGASTDVCEDIAQDAFLAAFANLGSFDSSRAAFSTWLLTIGRNKYVNMLRKKKPIVMDVLPERGHTRTPETEYTKDELFRMLDAALDALPFEQRSAFVFAEIQGLSYEEICLIEGVKLGTVKSRISRAREKLRSLFKSWRGTPNAVR